MQNKGFTLIEALVSMVIFSLILIGLLTAMVIAYKISYRNQIRNEAVQLAVEYLNTFKSGLNVNLFRHDKCSSADENDKVTKRIRNSYYPFYVVGKIEDKNYVYEVSVIICDKYKKEIYKTKTLVSKLK